MKKQNIVCRFLRHLVSNPWQVKHRFSQAALAHIEHAIKASENTHAGEIQFVVEAGLDPFSIFKKISPKKRAIGLFGHLNIWDTAHNNGVLIYLLLADRDVEIVADRGIHQHVGNAEWERICQAMETLFKQGQFEQGVLLGIAEIGALLQQHYPSTQGGRNEISNKPVLL